MESGELSRAFEALSTALIADACRQLGHEPRIAPPAIRPVVPGWKMAGQAHLVRHHGSVDAVLAGVTSAGPGKVLVLDNGGRVDEGCVGDLIALEAAAAGIAGMVIWGCHRDTLGLIAIDLPIFSLGAYPAGPRRATTDRDEAPHAVQIGPVSVTEEDVVFADQDGVLFVSAVAVARVLTEAAELSRREQAQADAVADGLPLRAQLRYQEYVDLSAADPAYTFREHLRRVGGAIEV